MQWIHNQFSMQIVSTVYEFLGKEFEVCFLSIVGLSDQ